MTRIILATLLALLWSLWAIFFFEVNQLASALAGTIIPESPVHYSGPDLVRWIGGVASLYGVPFLLAFATWRFFQSRRPQIKTGASE